MRSHLVYFVIRHLSCASFSETNSCPKQSLGHRGYQQTCFPSALSQGMVAYKETGALPGLLGPGWPHGVSCHHVIFGAL